MRTIKNNGVFKDGEYRQNIQKKYSKRIRKILSMGMAAILALSPITGEVALAKTAVPTLTKSVSVNKGKTKDITVKKNGTTIKKVTWKSSNKKIAVKPDGKLKATVKGIKEGNAKITASISYKSGKKTLSKKLICNVTVKEVVKPKKTTTPKVTEMAVSTTTPKVTEVAVPTTTPKVTEMAVPTITPVPSGTPNVTGTSTPTNTPMVTSTPETEGKVELILSEDGKTVEGASNKNGTYAIIPEGVTSIGDRAFSGCNNMRSITIPESVTSIGIRAFSFCSSLESITIPESVTSIGSSAFSECSSLRSITIPKSVGSIGTYAFSGCYFLKENVQNNSFKELEGITIVDSEDNGMCLIGSKLAGARFTQMKGDITIPEGVTSIGDSAFSGCINMSSITIPESVTSIGYMAFDGCNSLRSITIPKGVTSIGNYAFSGCYFVKENVKNNSTQKLEGATIVDSEDNGMCLIGSELAGTRFTQMKGNVTIPEGVTSIGDSAFRECSSLRSITIPEGVTSIGKSAFYGCGSLSGITIPESVTSIESGTFSECSSLGNITIPESVTRIGDDAFSWCSSLSSITIPESVTRIGSNAFEGCSSLSSITIPKGVTAIGWGTFSGCSSLSSITIPEGVTAIGR